MKTTTKDKVALVLGADGPVGRAVALQLSRIGCRIIAAGGHGKQLAQLAELILAKKGIAAEAVLPHEPAELVATLRAVRETVGHFHFIVNALEASGPADEHSAAPADVVEALVNVITGRGAVRFATVVNGRVKAQPLPANAWQAVIHIAGLAHEEDASPGESVKPAAVADVVVNLLQCPEGACPLEVRLAPRELKI